MKRNYVPENLIHHRADIEERNQYIDKLCADLAPVSQTVYAAALKRQASRETSQIIIDEARSTLKDLLGDVPEIKDHETQQLAKELERALEVSVSGVRPAEFQSAVKRNAQDLTRALVGFWFDLGSDEVERYKRTVLVSIGLVTSPRAGPSRGVEPATNRELNAICGRFDLEPREAYLLLGVLNAGAFAQQVAKRMDVNKKEMGVVFTNIDLHEMQDFPPAAPKREQYKHVHIVQLKKQAQSRQSSAVDSVRVMVDKIDDFHMQVSCEYAGDQAVRNKQDVVFAQSVNNATAHSTWSSVDSLVQKVGWKLEFQER